MGTDDALLTELAQLRARVAELERANTAMDAIGEGVITVDTEGRITYLNPAAEELTRWSRDDAVGRRSDEVFHALVESTRRRIPSPVADVLQGALASGRAGETILVGRDGSERPIAEAASPIFDRDAKVVGAIIAFRDQTRERAVQANLARSRAELMNLVARLPMAVFVTRAGRVDYANPAFAELVGYASTRIVVGLRPEELLRPLDRASDEWPPAAGPWRAQRDDGKAIVVEVPPPREIAFEGDVAMLWVVRDLTELHMMQAQLAQADRLASMGTLAAGIAHEINNPLAFVSASLEFIEETAAALSPRLASDERADLSKLILEARQGTARVRDVVRDLKTFSRVDVDIDARSSLDLVALIESSLQMTNNEIRHRARLVKDFGPVPRVVANEARLGQVFLNLLINAAHAIPPGAANAHEIRVVTRTTASGQASVEVTDTGVGMSPDVLARIFDPFFTTKPIGEGTGLGLSICRSTILAFGGTIDVQSQPGVGTTFAVTLPADANSTPAPAPTPPMATPIRRGRVLVVDDEVPVGEAVRRALSKDNDVVLVTAARDALTSLKAEPPFDVIICDVMMPEMSGTDFYDELLKTSPEFAARIVFLTGGTFTHQTAEFLKRIPNPCMTKPFDVTQLRGLVATFVK